MNDENQFSADDLSLLSDDGDGGAADTSAAAGEGSAEQKTAAADKSAQKPAAGAAKKPLGAGGSTDDDPKLEEQKGEYWPKDWREKAAEHMAAGDKKVYDRELRRLQRVTDPTGLYGMYRELEGKFTGGGLLKVPGKDAKPEDVAEFHKALGVPEKPEDYFKSIQLENGAVIGEADKPIADAFAAAVHKAGATPAVVTQAMNWYFKHQEEQAAALDEADDSFRREAEQALKEEYGPAFKRSINGIAAVFATAPGGADIKNEGSLYSRLMGGRTADGKIIGNDPDMVRFLVGIAREINPAATVVEDGDQSGMSIDAEIEKIEGIMRTNRREYDKKYADRYRQLLEAREKVRARAR